MFEFSKLDEQIDAGYTCFIVGDLKLTNLVMGLTSGNASFPCPKCYWNATDKEVDHFQPAPARTEEQWRKDVEIVNSGGLPRLNHSVERAPISYKLVQQPSIIVPPELHLCEGVVNKSYFYIQKECPELADSWAKAANVYMKNYHGGKFTGPQCQKLLKTLTTIKEQYERIYIMLYRFKQFTQIAFKCAPIAGAHKKRRKYESHQKS